MGSLLAISLLLGASGADFVTPLSQAQRAEAITWIAKMKANRRGPYSGVAWICKDGQILPPKSYACVKFGGGVQYGQLSRDALKLAERGLHVGTILTSLKASDLLENDFYRMRALVVEAYLERALDGWTLVSAKSYRGFRQVEDEQESARELLIELAQRKDMLTARRSLMARLIRSLPYGRQGSLADEIRAAAGLIGDADTKFANLRFKIHAMPEPTDIPKVVAYADSLTSEKTKELKVLATELAAKMTKFYDPASRVARLEQVKGWIHDENAQSKIAEFIAADLSSPIEALTKGHALMEAAEQAMVASSSHRQGERNLLHLHSMILVEELWIGITAELSRMAMTRERALYMVQLLAESAHRVAMLSARELQEVRLLIIQARTAEVPAYAAAVSDLTRMLQWGRDRVIADVGVALTRYESVEPRARGVIDDILRSGVMLPLATVLDRLATDIEKLRGGGHHLLGLEKPAGSRMRGENPGFAAGPLRILAAGADPSLLKRHEVVLLNDLPPSLPPVAAIITVGAAGSLSHVALLARNLGIPHASVSSDLALTLAPWSGREIVVGVSAGRRVVIGEATSFSADDLKPLAKRKLSETPFLSIDGDALDLKTTRIHMLSEISPADSGIRVGPKAAELGRLKKLFPSRVSGAAVIPFGAFLQHVDRPGEADAPSPMAKLRAIYAQAASLEPDAAEAMVLEELKRFRASIAALPFAPGFEADVVGAIARLGDPGKFGMFIRSDTNVEDLKEFTGAGLNKTVANRVARKSVLRAIRAVWQSPFTERSYRWRQRILKTPEHVYPSVILHRTVPSEMSGVMVTADLHGGSDDAITVCTSEGVAAVVDGGSPETIVVQREGRDRFLASSRSITRKLIPEPPREGVVNLTTEGRDPLLGPAEIAEIKALAAEVTEKMPSDGHTPWDMEFGFLKGKVWLLQIRPLRTSQAPAANPFLRALDEQTKLPDGKLQIDAELQL